jgi:hypothetical protein
MIRSIPSFDIQKTTHLIIVVARDVCARLDIDLVKKLKLPHGTPNSISFMGCYAAFNAFKIADAFCQADENAKKYLSYAPNFAAFIFRRHRQRITLYQMLIRRWGGGSFGRRQDKFPRRLKAENFFSDLVIEGESDMAWAIGGSWVLRLKLSTYCSINYQMGRSISQTDQKLYLLRFSKNINDVRFSFAMTSRRSVKDSL